MLELRDLQLTRGSFSLKGVSLQVREREYFVLVGPTGCGKTMLLETIAGLEMPVAGQVIIGGEDVTPLGPELRRLGYVPQDYALFPHWTVEGNILSGCLVQGVAKAEAQQRAEEMADLLRIRHLLPRRIRGLSGGERQRVALARALVTHPRLLLMDEPLAALDPSTKSRLWRELKALHRELGLTTIHVTHDFGEAHALADTTGLLHNGGFLQIGPPHDIFRRPRNRLAAEFVGVQNIYPGDAVAEGGEGLCRMVLAEGVEAFGLAEGPGPVDLFVHPEDVVLAHEGCRCVHTRNVFRGVVSAILDRGALAEVTLDIGVPMIATVTERQCRELELEEGAVVTAWVGEDEAYMAARGG